MSGEGGMGWTGVAASTSTEGSWLRRRYQEQPGYCEQGRDTEVKECPPRSDVAQARNLQRAHLPLVQRAPVAREWPVRLVETKLVGDTRPSNQVLDKGLRERGPSGEAELS